MTQVIITSLQARRRKPARDRHVGSARRCLGRADGDTTNNDNSTEARLKSLGLEFIRMMQAIRTYRWWAHTRRARAAAVVFSFQRWLISGWSVDTERRADRTLTYQSSSDPTTTGPPHPAPRCIHQVIGVARQRIPEALHRVAAVQCWEEEEVRRHHLHRVDKERAQEPRRVGASGAEGRQNDVLQLHDGRLGRWGRGGWGCRGCCQDQGVGLGCGQEPRAMKDASCICLSSFMSLSPTARWGP